MSSVTEPLRAEHRELLPHVEQLLSAGDAAQSGVFTWAGVETAGAFLTKHLLPHAMAEEAALYPVVGRIMGSSDATRTMARDHSEIKRLSQELVGFSTRLAGSDLTPDQFNQLRRVLYGLYALVKVHFAKEEEIYLPLLDQHLSSDEGREMFAAMERAAAQAKSPLTA